MSRSSAVLRCLRRSAAVACLLAATLGTSVEAATIQGTFTYAGNRVDATFSAFNSTAVIAYCWDDDTVSYGTVDMATESYRVEGLAAGTYEVSMLLSNPTSLDSLGFTNPRSGDLRGRVEVTLAAEETHTEIIELNLALHYTQPYDSLNPIPGAGLSCPKGGPAPASSRVTWTPVPFAVSYQVDVSRFNCASGLLTSNQTIVTAPSVSVQQGVASGEEYIDVRVYAFDSLGQTLSIAPYSQYDDSNSTSYYLHPGDAPARPLHPSASWFIIQAAHAAGVPPSYWKTDLILTNPTGADITATVRYTPRGEDGTQYWVETSVLVPAGTSNVYADAVSSLLGADGAGSIEVANSPALEVMARTYTPGSGGGTYGQGYPAVDLTSAAALGGTHGYIGAGGVTGGDFRTNLSLAEIWGEQAEVRVTLRDGSGNQLGQKTYTIEPFSSIQVNDLIGKLGGPASLTGGQVEVEVTHGSGRVAGALSVADQTTDDPTTIPLIPR